MGKRILTPAYEAILSTLLSQFEAEFDRSLQEINVAVHPTHGSFAPSSSS